VKSVSESGIPVLEIVAARAIVSVFLSYLVVIFINKTDFGIKMTYSVARYFSPVILLIILSCQTASADDQFADAYKASQSGNYTKAMQLWKPLAEQGQSSAQYALGWLYESGQGTTQSYAQAAYWYRKAAEQGDLAAQYVLATMYEKGVGVELDIKQAVQWYLKAANQGDAIAQFKLGTYFHSGKGIAKNERDSFFWFNKAAHQGHITSQINLGKIYQEGRGVQQDYVLAIQWYKLAAKQGDALAQYQLATLYELGRGTGQDLPQAKELYLASAPRYAPSAYKLAEFYEQGKTDDVNLTVAIEWYKIAANRGNSAAQYRLGVIYQNGLGVEANINTAIEWYFNASKQDNPKAIYELGNIYEHGVIDLDGKQSIAVDYYKASLYYQKAIKLDYNLAYEPLGILYENGYGVVADLGRALYLYQHSNQPSAQIRFNALSKQITCQQTATTSLFSVSIACTNRKELDQQIQSQSINPIDEKRTEWSDTYYTGAVIKGSSELTVNYTMASQFASAQYTFVGRNKPTLITQVKNLLTQKYGEPTLAKGNTDNGKASFTWFLDDGIELMAHRNWPDTTTYVTYSLPENVAILAQEQKQQLSSEKQSKEQSINLNLF